MIITLASFKGGVGKTTTAIGLAHWLNQNRGATLLIDGDPNRSAAGWAKRGSLNFEVCDQLSAPRKVSKFDNIVIDMPARPSREDLESLTEGADLLVLPTTPTSLSLDALVQSLNLLDDIGSDYVIALTIVPSAPRQTGIKARDALVKLGAPVLEHQVRQFAAYEKASTEGCIVGDVKRDQNAGNAQRDTDNLSAEIVELAESLIKAQ
jgi:chromosome partitioning protein